MVSAEALFEDASDETDAFLLTHLAGLSPGEKIRMAMELSRAAQEMTITWRRAVMGGVSQTVHLSRKRPAPGILPR